MGGGLSPEGSLNSGAEVVTANGRVNSLIYATILKHTFTDNPSADASIYTHNSLSYNIEYINYVPSSGTDNAMPKRFEQTFIPFPFRAYSEWKFRSA